MKAIISFYTCWWDQMQPTPRSPCGSQQGYELADPPHDPRAPHIRGIGDGRKLSRPLLQPSAVYKTLNDLSSDPNTVDFLKQRGARWQLASGKPPGSASRRLGQTFRKAVN